MESFHYNELEIFTNPRITKIKFGGTNMTSLMGRMENQQTQMLAFQKICVIVAGPNGSGKSSFVKDCYSQGLLTKVNGPYICGDDFAKQIKKANPNLTQEEANKAAQQAVFDTRERLGIKGENFVLETVFSHPSHLDFLKRLKKQGYWIVGIFICTDNPNINIQRVDKRVSEGGHDVPDEKVKHRYLRCLDLCPQLLDACDDFKVFDNTEQPKCCILKNTDGLQVLDKSYQWVQKILEQISQR